MGQKPKTKKNEMWSDAKIGLKMAELCPYKVGAKVAFQPKIGQDATFAPTLNWHNSAIFYPILTTDYIKMMSLSRRIEWCSIRFILVFSFDPFFAPRPHMGSIARMDPKPRSSCWYMSRPSPSIMQIVCTLYFMHLIC